MNREQAQARIDRIHAFRNEMATLDEEGVAIPVSLRDQIAAHHRVLLTDLAGKFDIDSSSTQKSLSWGMRIVSLFGALAFSAAFYSLYMRFRGDLGTATQVVILIAFPLLATYCVEIAARRERTLYFSTIVALVAFAAFVLSLSMLGEIFNITPTQNAFLAWSLHALLLAYAYGLRLMLIVGLTCVMGYVAASVNTWHDVYWLSFIERPENILFGGAAIASVGLLKHHPVQPSFAAIYRNYGMFAVFVSILVLSVWSEASYLPLSNAAIEKFYQSIAFVIAGLTIWLGIRRRWPGLTHLSTSFFVIYLCIKMFDWWWDWMPKYLFFLLFGLVAIGLLLLLRRMRSQQRREPHEI